MKKISGLGVFAPVQVIVYQCYTGERNDRRTAGLARGQRHLKTDILDLLLLGW